MQKGDVPDRFAFKAQYLGKVEGWINPGESVIVNPDGKVVAGPISEHETILYAELDRAMITGPRWQLDVGGHYARPDVFELRVHRTPKPLFTLMSDSQESDTAASGQLGDANEAR
jgi:nitrilase